MEESRPKPCHHLHPMMALASTDDRVLALARVQAALRQRFEGCGCVARAAALALLPLDGLPSTSAKAGAKTFHAALELVDEALYRLWEQGIVESHCLADGSLAYQFPRR